MIAKYLEKEANIIFQNKNEVDLSLICRCGNDHFDLWENPKSEKTEEEKISEKIKKDFGSSFVLVVEAGKVYIEKKFLGLVIKKKEYTDYKITHPFHPYVAACCTKCGKMIPLFDEENAALLEEPGKIPNKLEIHKKNITQIQIRLFYSDPTSPIDFSRIKITGKEHGKKITVIDSEL